MVNDILETIGDALDHKIPGLGIKIVMIDGKEGVEIPFPQMDVLMDR